MKNYIIFGKSYKVFCALFSKKRSGVLRGCLDVVVVVVVDLRLALNVQLYLAEVSDGRADHDQWFPGKDLQFAVQPRDFGNLGELLGAEIVVEMLDDRLLTRRGSGFAEHNVSLQNAAVVARELDLLVRGRDVHHVSDNVHVLDHFRKVRGHDHDRLVVDRGKLDVDLLHHLYRDVARGHSRVVLRRRDPNPEPEWRHLVVDEQKDRVFFLDRTKHFPEAVKT